MIVRDPLPPLQRLLRLDEIERGTDCGVDERIRRRHELIPLYDAIVEEAADIVHENPQYQSWLKKFRWQLRMLHLDSLEAVEEESRKGWK